MRREKSAILWIDRGSKYIGLAYYDKEKIIMPIGYILNDKVMLFTLADIIQKYRAKEIIVGYPSRQKDIQAKITSFIRDIVQIVDEDVVIEMVEEDYTSVEAWEILSEFRKNAGEDTVSAMKILERRQVLNS